MIKDEMRKKKFNAPSDVNNANHKKSSAPQDKDKTNKKKNNTTTKWKWETKEKPMRKKEFTLEQKVLIGLDHGISQIADL